ncbi:MAG: hypothetical protein C4531_14315 [Desulfurivibrio sp.]|nr:MAG: hypothetical protein C4531_14315 [Desulfurivibrio sp.]
MAVNTTNSAALAMMNQYKLNMAATLDEARELSSLPDRAGDNRDYEVRLSAEALQLAQQEKIRHAHDLTPPTALETEATLSRSRFEFTTQHMETTHLARQNQAEASNGIEVVA